jgi:hypothetical protein
MSVIPENCNYLVAIIIEIGCRMNSWKSSQDHKTKVNARNMVSKAGID